jgi:hypothetical protein
MPAKTKAVKRGGAQPSNEGPQLVWEKSSFKHYVARGLGGACLEVVRSGSRTSFNETWHPVVFGNRFAYAKSFERWPDAALAAERLAVEYAQRVLAKLRAMPVASLPEEGTPTPAAVKLSKAQLAELKRLAQTIGRRSFGKGRVRVHNNLRRHGLAQIIHHDGFVCEITQAGRDYLRALEARR